MLSSHTHRNRSTLAIVSPLGVIVLGQLLIRALSPVLGRWSWLPFLLCYALALILLAILLGGRASFAKWFQPSRGGARWTILAVAVPALLTLPIFIPNWNLLLAPQVILSTLLFVLVNPAAEEIYWRGAILDATERWPRWVGIAYSTAMFAANHLWIGVIAPAGRHPSALAGPVLMGMVWSLAYLRTGSLRWPLVGHVVANLLSLSVPVFLGLYVPPGMPGG